MVRRVRWLDREEQLFRALENVVIRERLEAGFRDVDDFIEYSLSVQNRRKARMGFALQNHLTEIFKRADLRFTAQARTEGNNRPDFIFPGKAEYDDRNFESDRLTMLAAKSTCKDRWRQLLTEADRIQRKHLLTLEPAITPAQTSEMQQKKLRLVVPGEIQATYTAAQRLWLLAVSEVARNIVEYAKEGEVIITLIDDANKKGVEIVAADQGPGIAVVSTVMRDGYSTGKGLGIGLPGARRLMDEFEIASEVGKGTTVRMKKWVV